jgi:DNA polymerase IV
MLLPYIAHIDLDCFFVSVERIKDPSLIGKPVVVGGSSNRRGVIASASYEARKFGIHSAMPTARAMRLCPELIVVGGHHHLYSEYSDRLYEHMINIAPIVERASIDEMYLDFTGCENLYDGDLPGYMKILQTIVLSEFKLPCTIGLASNKLVAKIAANRVKPAGVIFVPHGKEERYLAPLPIGVIPGIGKKTEELLQDRGFKLVADLQAVSVKDICRLLGAHGEWIYNASHGRGSSTLAPEHDAKSISREETFSEDISETEILEKKLFALVEDVCASLRRHNLKARTVTLKLRTSDFKTTTHQYSHHPTDYDPEIRNISMDLLTSNHDGKTPLRLIGIGLSNFTNESQLELDLESGKEKRDKILKAFDRLRNKYGDDSIKFGES